MENNITVNMENLSEEEREQLMKLIQKSNGFKSKMWKPNYGRKYFYINDCGAIINSKWYDDVIDTYRYEIGNFFKTKEETEFALEKVKVETELRRFAEENNEHEIDWTDEDQEKWCMCYSYYYGNIYFIDAGSYKRNDIYFTSKEIGEQAIKHIGEERLKKYYFEVED